MTAANAPRDRYNAVWIIFFILGLGTLLPWNFFMTATMYFTSRLKNGEHNLTANVTVAIDNRNVFESKFNNVMTLCAMVPLLIFTCLNSFIHQSLFGLAGMLPASYTTPIMSGQGLAGTFAAFSMICALASGSALQDSAFGYFITACVVILLAIVSYFALPKMEFFQYYSESNGSRSSSDEENKMDLLKPEGHAEKRPVLSLTDEESRPAVSVFGIFKQIWVMALSVCFVFTITIGVFPAVTVDVKTTVVEEGNGWNTYFIPVSCFLLFNLMDWAGRSLTAVCMWPGKDSIWLPILVIARLVFVPLFMLCNVQPRHYLPMVFSHDAWYIVFMILFSFSNGYLASLCMCFGPKKVSQHEAETAGAIMAFFLSLGLAVGAALSFAFRAMI
uniref:Equilibrative nucleoside transporter 1-like n=1 Tax=Sinocyclocheilus rhinocerous TaxID=307959 RepID=A0A673J175_9TELE